MGGLPLALEQAAAYLTQVEMMPFADYLAAFRDQKARSDLMRHAPQYGSSPRFLPQTRAQAEALTVLTTWQMSLANLERDHPHAVDLLRLCAFLHPVGIPRELVIALLPDYFTAASNDTVQQNALYNRLLNALTGYSLIQRNLDNATHSIHILVQTVLRDNMSLEEQKQVCEGITTAIANTFSAENWGRGEMGELYYPHAIFLCDYAERISLESEAVGRLLHHTGATLFHQAQFAEVESYLQRALVMRQKILPADHSDIAECLSDLALMYHHPDRFAEAELLHLQALAIQRKVFPEGHPVVADNLNNLAYLYSTQQRFAEAESLHQQALAMRRKLFPEGHPDIANSLHNLAGSYRNQKRFAEAEVFYQEAIEIWQKTLPKDHPATGYGLHGLARLYRDQSRFIEAESLFQQTLELWQKKMPEGHPNIVIVVNSLAEFYQSQERNVEAKSLMQQVLTIRRKMLPAEHADIAASLSDLAELYREQGCFAEAVPLFQEAVSILLSTRGIEHPDYQVVLTNYQNCAAQMKKEEAA